MSEVKPPKALGLMAIMATMGPGLDDEIMNDIIHESDFFKGSPPHTKPVMTKEQDEEVAKEAEFSFHLFEQYVRDNVKEKCSTSDIFRIGFAQGAKWWFDQERKKGKV